jgi:hypothetical protein
MRILLCVIGELVRANSAIAATPNVESRWVIHCDRVVASHPMICCQAKLNRSLVVRDDGSDDHVCHWEKQVRKIQCGHFAVDVIGRNHVEPTGRDRTLGGYAG